MYLIKIELVNLLALGYNCDTNFQAFKMSSSI